MTRLRRALAALLAFWLALTPGAFAVTPAQLAALSGRPAWVQGGATFSVNFGSTCGLFLLGKSYYGQVITSQFSTWSTPGHYATRSNGVLVSVPANTPDCVAGGDLGQLVEESRTNVVLYSNDLTQTSAWTATNITTAKDQTGPDGVANSASSITAGANNGTILQAITLASSARFQTAYVKRITGSGTVSMTMDNGSTYTAVTVTGSWSRVSIATQTLANPTVGFKLATSGDKIAVWGVQNENGTFSTSPIVTTTGAVTRSASTITRTLGTEFNPAACALYANWITSSISVPVSANENAFTLDNGAISNRLDIYREATTANSVGRVTTASVLVYGQSGATGIGANTRIKGFLTATTNNILFTGNGVVGFASGTAAMPSGITTMRIGRNSGGNYANGPIAQVALFPTNNVSVNTQ